MFHDDILMTKKRFYQNHLPPLKANGGHATGRKPTLPVQPRQRMPTFLPPVTQKRPTGSVLDVYPGKSTMSIATNISAAHDAAQRILLRNQLAKFTQETSSSNFSNSPQGRRKTLYQHVQAKVNTGLSRHDTVLRQGTKINRAGQHHTLNWSAFKQQLEHDKDIQTHASNIEFNTGENYAVQLTALGDLVRSKVKSHLATGKINHSDRYKIVVHLTVIPRAAAGLHVASRCLWNTRTDNSVTMKIPGVDCEVLMIVFLCYTDVEAI